MSATLDPVERAWLQQFLTSKFSLGELKVLAFDIGVDHQCFGYAGIQEFTRELIAYLDRHEQLGSLVAEVLKRYDNDEVVKLMARLPLSAPQVKVQ